MIEQYVTLSTERRAASTPRVTPTALPLDTCRSWRLISLRLASFKRRVRRSYAHSSALAHKQASQEGTSRCPECGPPSERPLSAAPKPAVGPIHVPIPGTRPCAARRGAARAPARSEGPGGRAACAVLHYAKRRQCSPPALLLPHTVPGSASSRMHLAATAARGRLLRN